MKKNPCSPFMVNEAGMYINSFAYSALIRRMSLSVGTSEHVTSQEGHMLEEASPYISAVGNVLMTTVKYLNSHAIRETFDDAVEQFEKMLFSVFFTPTERYRLAKKIADYAESIAPRAGALEKAMNGILADAFFPSKGLAYIPNRLEIQADRWAQEHRDHEYESSRVEWEKDCLANARRESPQQKIADAMQGKKYDVVEDELFKVFQELAGSPSNSFTQSYFTKTADHLAGVSLKNIFQLAARCIYEIDEKAIIHEKVEAAVYGFAVEAIESWEAHKGGDYSQTHPLNLFMMKRSAAFKTDRNAEDIFDYAARNYREYLGSISPQQRYDEILTISKWLEGQTDECKLLQEFVDDLMNSAQLYGQFLGIPLQEDTRPVQWDAGRSPS